MTVVLACDLGSSGLRAGLVDDAGTLRAVHKVPLATEHAGEADGIDPETWWQALVACAGALRDVEPGLFAQIGAVAIGGMTRTQVLLDAHGAAVRPALSWADTRAEAMMDEIAGRLPASHPETPQVNAYHPAARLAWIARREPNVFARIAAVVDPKDYLNARLTGRVASDAISQARLDASRVEHEGGSILSALGLDPRLVPPLLPPTSIIGKVQGGLAAPLDLIAGAPVVTMAHDTWASVAGLGALREGFAYNLSGTTEVLGVLGHEVQPAEGLLRVGWGHELTQIGGPSLAGGDTVAWVMEVLAGAGTGEDVGAALERVLARPRSEVPLLFLPYLKGERVPYWDPGLRGAFVGLAREHTAADLAHAVMEGVAFLNRIVLERAEAAAGGEVGEIRFGGGGAQSVRWCQIKADVTGRTVAVTDTHEHGLIGAAIAAAVATGGAASIGAAQDRLVRVAKRYMPDPQRHEASTRLYEVFRQTEAALAPVSRQLAGLGKPVA
jgi:xylulokinase